MDIYLANHANVRNTNFCNEAGQVLYKSDTPGSFLSRNRTTKISKVVPHDSPEDMLDHFDELAAIEWHTLGSSVLTYGGFKRPMKEFMPSKGIFAQHRVFTAPGDGRSFRWTLGMWTCSLVLDDGSKTPVAESHRSNAGLVGKPRQARLEIFSGFEHLVDVILIGFVFVEKLRKERERAAESSGGGS
ncbi:hypothetical protein FIBSPDRAFT_835949 [Athelia psychrophila]|uniref:DUF6593 domain-containing protein n=1 Tax=Athelia psychrophila TaxID=1759441 RepID=A0A166BL61_9AGAM|nr:hypothetical protein FIBSPDRAFT_835949 [Fibularhizoctonia sp. CBS 109695]